MNSSAEFEWDDAKDETNLAKHAVPLGFGTLIFLDEKRVDLDVSRAQNSEERRKVIGRVDGLLFVAVYTLRGDVVRLISVRRANAKESRSYGTKAYDTR